MRLRASFAALGATAALVAAQAPSAAAAPQQTEASCPSSLLPPALTSGTSDEAVRYQAGLAAAKLLKEVCNLNAAGTSSVLTNVFQESSRTLVPRTLSAINFPLFDIAGALKTIGLLPATDTVQALKNLSTTAVTSPSDVLSAVSQSYGLTSIASALPVMVDKTVQNGTVVVKGYLPEQLGTALENLFTSATDNPVARNAELIKGFLSANGLVQSAVQAFPIDSILQAVFGVVNQQLAGVTSLTSTSGALSDPIGTALQKVSQAFATAQVSATTLLGALQTGFQGVQQLADGTTAAVTLPDGSKVEDVLTQALPPQSPAAAARALFANGKAYKPAAIATGLSHTYFSKAKGRARAKKVSATLRKAGVKAKSRSKRSK